MKKWIVLVLGITFSTLLFVATSCTHYDSNTTTLHLSPMMCGVSLNGITPESFCEAKGKDTWLYGKYVSAHIDQDGCLILTLSDETITEWKNTFLELQVLQCVFGDARDIGITVDYSMDFLSLMEDAHTCGFEISEDYAKIIASPEDCHWYFPTIMGACAKMQMFSGKTCQDLRVEYIEIDANGEIKLRDVLTGNSR